jgi:hypothetical protein
MCLLLESAGVYGPTSCQQERIGANNSSQRCAVRFALPQRAAVGSNEIDVPQTRRWDMAASPRHECIANLSATALGLAQVDAWRQHRFVTPGRDIISE